MTAMGLLSIFSRKRNTSRQGPSPRLPQHSTGPKNGPLTLAVIGTIVLGVVLSILNYRLISDPSVCGKAFGTSTESGPEFVPTEPSKGPEANSPSSCSAPPKITFYRQLTQVDETPSPVQEHTSSLERPPPSGEPAAENQASAGKSAKPAAQEHFSSPAMSPGTAQLPTALPRSKPGPALYTVQVGAFSDPAVAQQWAQKWKARGYNVSLRPVARPRTGIIYRLYLGKFSSQHEADELVDRLKHREGIAAFRLLVRN